MFLANINWQDFHVWLRLAVVLVVLGIGAGNHAYGKAAYRQEFAKKWQLTLIEADRLLQPSRSAVTSTWSIFMLVGVYAIVLPVLTETVAVWSGGSSKGFRLVFIVLMFGGPALCILMGAYLLVIPRSQYSYGMGIRALKPSDLPANRSFADIEAALKAYAAPILSVRILGIVFLVLSCAGLVSVFAFHLLYWIGRIVPNS